MAAIGTEPRPTTGCAAHAGARLVGCCILDGGVRPSPLVEETGRSVLDLDVGPDRRLLDVWLEALADAPWSLGRPTVRILHGGTAGAPSPRPAPGADLRIMADAGAYRGPAGVVRDALRDEPEDAEFLVCEAARYLRVGLPALVEHHRSAGADVTIAREGDGSPAGIMLVSRRSLSAVAERGFVDLKEQWLARLVERGSRVIVHDLDRGSTLAVRTRLDLLRAAAIEAGAGAEPADGDAEPWRAGARLSRRLRPGWSISPGARIGEGAVVARSIVMEGAVVGEGAVVASSVILPTGVVPPGVMVMDRVVR